MYYTTKQIKEIVDYSLQVLKRGTDFDIGVRGRHLYVYDKKAQKSYSFDIFTSLDIDWKIKLQLKLYFLLKNSTYLEQFGEQCNLPLSAYIQKLRISIIPNNGKNHIFCVIFDNILQIYEIQNVENTIKFVLQKNIQANILRLAEEFYLVDNLLFFTENEFTCQAVSIMSDLNLYCMSLEGEYVLCSIPVGLNGGLATLHHNTENAANTVKVRSDVCDKVVCYTQSTGQCVFGDSDLLSPTLCIDSVTVNQERFDQNRGNCVLNLVEVALERGFFVLFNNLLNNLHTSVFMPGTMQRVVEFDDEFIVISARLNMRNKQINISESEFLQFSEIRALRIVKATGACKQMYLLFKDDALSCLNPFFQSICIGKNEDETFSVYLKGASTDDYMVKISFENATAHIAKVQKSSIHHCKLERYSRAPCFVRGFKNTVNVLHQCL